MAADDEYYRYASDTGGTRSAGESFWRFILYRPSTGEIFEMKYQEQQKSGHLIADGLEAWTRPAVRMSCLLSFSHVAFLQ